MRDKYFAQARFLLDVLPILVAIYSPGPIGYNRRVQGAQAQVMSPADAKLSKLFFAGRNQP